MTLSVPRGRPKGLWSVTTELNIDVAGPLPTDGQQVRATAAPARLDAAGGLARGDDHGPLGHRARADAP